MFAKRNLDYNSKPAFLVHRLLLLDVYNKIMAVLNNRLLTYVLHSLISIQP